MSKRKGVLLILSAPSGCGKDAILERALTQSPGLWRSVSVTSRAARTGERGGIDYTFTDKTGFERMIAGHELLEYTSFVGNYYGTPKKPVLDRLEAGQDVILKIEVEGADNIRRIFPNAVLIFVLPPSLEVLKRRLTLRGSDDPEKIAERLARSRIEMTFAKKYDYIIVNDELEQAVADLLHIYRAELLRTKITDNPNL